MPQDMPDDDIEKTMLALARCTVKYGAEPKEGRQGTSSSPVEALPGGIGRERAYRTCVPKTDLEGLYLKT